jgi:hypothetical protein
VPGLGVQRVGGQAERGGGQRRDRVDRTVAVPGVPAGLAQVLCRRHQPVHDLPGGGVRPPGPDQCRGGGHQCSREAGALDLPGATARCRRGEHGWCGEHGLAAAQRTRPVARAAVGPLEAAHRQHARLAGGIPHPGGGLVALRGRVTGACHHHDVVGHRERDRGGQRTAVPVATEREVHHLRTLLHRPHQSVGHRAGAPVAVVGVEHPHRQHCRARRQAADRAVGPAHDQRGHGRAVADRIYPGIGRSVHVVLACEHPPGQVGMGGVHAGVQHRHGHPGPGGQLPRLLGTERDKLFPGGLPQRRRRHRRRRGEERRAKQRGQDQGQQRAGGGAPVGHGLIVSVPRAGRSWRALSRHPRLPLPRRRGRRRPAGGRAGSGVPPDRG